MSERERERERESESERERASETECRFTGGGGDLILVEVAQRLDDLALQTTTPQLINPHFILNWKRISQPWYKLRLDQSTFERGLISAIHRFRVLGSRVKSSIKSSNWRIAIQPE